MNRIVIAASVATIGSFIIAGLMYFESTTRTEPSTHSAQDSVESAKQPEIGRGEGMSKPEVIRERKVDSEEKSSAVIEVPVEWREGVALGYSGEELRKANEVRGMMPLEQGQELSSLRGVYGFVSGSPSSTSGGRLPCFSSSQLSSIGRFGEIDRVLSEAGSDADDLNFELLSHISPIGWDNVLLYGEYQLNRSLVRSERLSV